MAGTSNGKSFQNAETKSDNLKKISYIRAIFWDLDNTLIFTRLGDSKACRKLSEVLENQFGFTKDESSAATQAFLKSFRRCPDNSQTSLDSWRTYLWREALPTRYKHLAEQIYPKWLQLRVKYLALPAEHIQLLKRLRQSGFLLALITNGPSNAQWEKIHKLKVQQYFDCVLVSSDLPWEKPNPHIFHAACNFLGVQPRECAMIGDKLETDIKGGRLAELGATFWIPINQQADNDFSDVEYPPDFILKTLLDLYKYFPVNNSSSSSSSTSVVNGATAAASSSSASSSSAHNRNRLPTHIIRSTTTSTCNSDLQSLPHQQSFPLYQQVDNNLDSYSDISHNKHRRGGSLPAIDYSETENSSDSMLG